jgi:PAS domain S-box-containing protein
MESLTPLTKSAARNLPTALAGSRIEQRYAVLSGIGGQIVLLTNAAGEIVEPQASWSEFTGQTVAACSGFGWTNVVHPAELKTSLGRFKSGCQLGLPFRCEFRMRRADGKYRFFFTTANPILSVTGTVEEWLLLHLDVTDRKASDDYTAKALRELNDLKSAIDEHAIVAVTDAGGKITYVNDKFCAISQYSREELLSQDHRIINSGYHSKDFIKKIWQRISNGRVWKGEIKNKAKDGSFYWVDTTIVPYLGRDGRPLQYIAIRGDITERKLAEEALRGAKENLQKHASTLEHRSSALRETIGELEAFSYSVSHDMRAPLRAMQSFSKILSQECSAEVGPKGKEYIRRINEGAARMDALIQDVLTYSRVARTDLPLQPVDVSKLLRDIIETYPLFQRPSAEIDLVGPLPAPCGIPAVLTQCISNLLGNAIKFVEPGVTPKIRIWAELRDGGMRVRTFFKDNGLGIEKDMHESIFGIFQRVNKSYEGTGIGLSIVKKGMERMGGSVGLESELGEGSTFWLELATEQAK